MIESLFYRSNKSAFFCLTAFIFVYISFFLITNYQFMNLIYPINSGFLDSMIYFLFYSFMHHLDFFKFLFSSYCTQFNFFNHLVLSLIHQDLLTLFSLMDFLYFNIFFRLFKQNIIQHRNKLYKMRTNKNNHFVVRNGKLVPKTHRTEQDDLVVSQFKLVKPTAVVVKCIEASQPLSQSSLSSTANSNININISQSIITSNYQILYYEEKISDYEHRIQILQKLLAEKDRIIERLKEDRKLTDYLETERETQQSWVSQQLKDTVLGYQIDIPAMNSLQQMESLYQRSKTERYIPSFREPIAEQFSKNQSISTFLKNQKQKSIQQTETQEKGTEENKKPIFDTSTLLARLNKSASLVQNIKKFLQPSPTNSESSQESKKSQDLIKNNFFKKQKTQEQSPIESEAECDDEIEKFLEDLIEKNDQMQRFISELQSLKQQQISDIRKYYENLISKMQLNESRHCKKYDSRQTKSLDCWSDKQNINIDKQKKCIKSNSKPLQLVNDTISAICEDWA